MTHDPPVEFYGSDDCYKTRAYRQRLETLGVPYRFLDVKHDPDAADRLRALYADKRLKYPTVVVGGRRLRNPTQTDLDKELYRSGILPPAVIHEPHAQRFVRYMRPNDAFVSYTWRGDTIILTHIEVDPVHRGTGLGARLARQVFAMVRSLGATARISCPFMRKVAASAPEDRAFFGLDEVVKHHSKMPT